MTDSELKKLRDQYPELRMVTRKKRPRYTDEMIVKIWELKKKGVNNPTISKMLDASSSMVSRISTGNRTINKWGGDNPEAVICYRESLVKYYAEEVEKVLPTKEEDKDWIEEVEKLEKEILRLKNLFKSAAAEAIGDVDDE